MIFKNPFKKKSTGSIDIPPGESRYIEFGVEWNKEKREVRLSFGDKDSDVIILNEELLKKGYPVLTVAAKNADSIYMELIPDFDKMKIHMREILDVNEKKKFTGEKDAKLSFA